VGYYRQDFHTFDFESTVMDSLKGASEHSYTEEQVRGVAAKFLLRRNTMQQKVKTLSEGQKVRSLLALLVQKYKY
jgi:ATPase subunit of ABC transporter with duplicated ATPase domains